MKKIGIVFFLFSFSQCYAQNYFPFYKNRPAYYNFSNSAFSGLTYYSQAAISIDSFKVSGIDTVFYHYPIIDFDTTNGCYLKAYDTSFVGRQSIRSSNGFDKFFNHAGDTIFFKNNSTINDSWIFLNLSAGEKIVATMQSINTEMILGVTDSVKIISLQATDSSGNTIPNIFNGKIYKVGKSFGLISGYSFLHIPIDTISFSLIGIENPSIGLNAENLSSYSIYDFEIGDRFDRIGASYHAIAYSTNSCDSRIVIGKQVYGMDSVIYTFHEKFRSDSYNMGNYSGYFYDDTTTEKIIFSNENYLNANPFEWTSPDNSFGGKIWLENGIYPVSGTVKEYLEDLNFAFDPCLMPLTSTCIPLQHRYATGLGMTYSVFNEGGCSGSDILTYYRKNGIEWGDSLHCVPTGIDELNFQSSVNLFPNPASEKIVITGNFSPQKTQFILLNCLGEEIKCKMNSDNDSVSLDVSNLPSGFYFLVINKESELAHLKFFKN